MKLFVIKFGNALGDVIPLQNVAHAMAFEQATRATGKFHRPTFDSVIPEFVDFLEREAASGTLELCDLRGLPKTYRELAQISHEAIDLPIILSLFSKAGKLSSWTQESGNEIDFVDAITDIQEFGPEQNGTKAFQGYVLPSLDPPINYKALAELKNSEVPKQTQTATPVVTAGESDEANLDQKTTKWVDKGNIYKKKALIERLLPNWPSITNDFQHGGDLITEARVPNHHGEYFERPAIDWAKRKGKWTEREAPSKAQNLMANVPGKRYTKE